MTRPRLVTLGIGSIRWFKLASLTLTTVALLLCLEFVLHTNALSVFLFSSVAPVLVLLSVGLVGTALFLEYSTAHRLFAVETYPSGQFIFRQGDPGDCAYFIRSGEVAVIEDESGEIIARLGPGEYFGEMALLSDSRRNASVRTLTDVEVATLGKENFLSMVKLLPAAEEAVLATVQNRAMRAGGSPTR